MLVIKNLTAKVADKVILDGLDLQVPSGQVHAIMGPNGSGKTTLAYALTGKAGYEITGTALFDGVDLLSLEPEERAVAGVFLAFQHPIEIPGVGNMYFLRTAVNEIRKHKGLEEISAVDFFKIAKELMEKLEIDPALLNRSVNTGFSGGEKKRNEILQMLMLEPRLAILDETDSGLDIDALRILSQGIEQLRGPQNSILIITHHPQLLDKVRPDMIHVLASGRIVHSGGPELAREIQENGFGSILDTVTA